MRSNFFAYCCLAVAILFATNISAERNKFPVEIDYSRTLAQMIAAGKYYAANVSIDDRFFHIQGEGKKKVVLEIVRFHWAISGDEARSLIQKRGLQPARLEHLLAFGAAYPLEQKKYSIVALGTVWKSGKDKFTAFLYYGVKLRWLRLNWGVDEWEADFAFLAIGREEQN